MTLFSAQTFLPALVSVYDGDQQIGSPLRDIDDIRNTNLQSLTDAHGRRAIQSVGAQILICYCDLPGVASQLKEYNRWFMAPVQIFDGQDTIANGRVAFCVFPDLPPTFL